MCGLVSKPEDWEWSSCRPYATGIDGVVDIESEWTVSRRERLGINAKLPWLIDRRRSAASFLTSRSPIEAGASLIRNVIFFRTVAIAASVWRALWPLLSAHRW